MSISESIGEMDLTEVEQVIELAAARLPQRTALRAALRGILHRRFSGISKEISDEFWESLISGKEEIPFDPNSPALPESWTDHCPTE